MKSFTVAFALVALASAAPVNSPQGMRVPKSTSHDQETDVSIFKERGTSNPAIVSDGYGWKAEERGTANTAIVSDGYGLKSRKRGTANPAIVSDGYGWKA